MVVLWYFKQARRLIAGSSEETSYCMQLLWKSPNKLHTIITLHANQIARQSLHSAYDSQGFSELADVIGAVNKRF